MGTLSIQRDIEGILTEAGIKAGDRLLVFSDISYLKKLCGFSRWGDTADFLIQCFRNILGPMGTLIVPAFNFDFCIGKPYSHEKSRSHVGIFSDAALNQPASQRTYHPIYSFTVIGHDTPDIYESKYKTSFGYGSPFQIFHEMNVKVLCFSVPFTKCTFIHYVEQAKGVCYRYLKNFSSKIYHNGNEFIDTYDFYVRDLDIDPKVNLERFKDQLIEREMMSKHLLGGESEILVTDCKKIYDGAFAAMEKDPFILVNLPKVSIDL